MRPPTPGRLSAACLAACLLLACGCVQRRAATPGASTATPLSQPGAALLKRWRWIPAVNVDVDLKAMPEADGSAMALRAAFTKEGDERRLVAFETRLEGEAATAKALVLRYRLRVTDGASPRLGLVVFESDGGAWFRTGRPLPQRDQFGEERLSLARLRPAAFSQDPDGALTWNEGTRTWLGLLVDGPAKGVFEVSRAAYTPEPYRPSEPLRITGDGPGVWGQSNDPAVKGTLTTPAEGPDGKPCMKYEFTMPGGRHMYAIARTPARGDEFSAYKALRFTYKAALPPGIGGLFVALQEANGAQYYIDGKSEGTVAQPTAEWKTITIPFAELKLGQWSKDDNGALDLDQVDAICIGCHGTTSARTGKGAIWVADVLFVP